MRFGLARERRRSSRGVTIVELVVVLLILGVLLALVPAVLPAPTPEGGEVRARRRAIEEARPVRSTDSAGRSVLHLPDGTEVGRWARPIEYAP